MTYDIDTLNDIKATLVIVRDDLKYKEQRLKEYIDGGDVPQATLLQAEIKGIKGVLEDLEPVVYR